MRVLIPSIDVLVLKHPLRQYLNDGSLTKMASHNYATHVRLTFFLSAVAFIKKRIRPDKYASAQRAAFWTDCLLLLLVPFWRGLVKRKQTVPMYTSRVVVLVATPQKSRPPPT